VTEHGEWGTIQSSFGKSGKFKLLFPGGIREANVRVFLIFKRFVFDKDKRQMKQ
jgi:hypothetical protein